MNITKEARCPVCGSRLIIATMLLVVLPQRTLECDDCGCVFKESGRLK
jgi:transcription elongation factor Elf1